MSASPTLHVHHSNHTEVLAAALGELLDAPVGGPFDAECVVVQSHGMATWLSQQLARRHGVAAHFDFPFPRNFVQRAYRTVLGDAVPERAFTRERLLWGILAALPGCLPGGAFARLRRYLGDEAAGVRRFQLARRVAGVFDQYLTYRPEMVRAWEAGDDGDLGRKEQAWQPQLWREVVARLGGGHAAALEASFDRALAAGVPTELPRRLSLFGIASLPPLYVRVLASMARHVDVHLFVLSAQRPADGARSDHPLLASLGLLGVEFETVLSEACAAAGVACERDARFVAVEASSRLSRLQAELLGDVVPPPVPVKKAARRSGHPVLPFGEPTRSRPLAPADRSVTLHSCHGPMREVEVLRDQLLDVLAQDTGIEPRDVVVMMPDVETYAPLVEAVFGRDRDDPLFIPYRIADRKIRSESPVVEALQRILALVGGRAPASEILDLLRLEPVYRRFGFEPADLEQLAQWITASGIRWGIDAADRGRHGQPEVRENTWRHGLDRMCLGYAMPGDGREVFCDVLPFDEIEGQSAALLGRLAEFCERLFGQLTALDGERPLPQWRDAIAALLEAMLAQEPQNAWQHERIRSALAEMVEAAAEVGFELPVDLTVLRELLDPQIDEAVPERGFLSGGVTFCAFLPMRSVPFRMVCMLGMGDGAFPRADRTVDFDLIGREPRRPGDRLRRVDDRYLFLEAILAARERLLITYSGQSIRDNRALPPSVLVSELGEALRASPGDDVVIRHPLQGFSRSYFEPSSERLFSYAEQYLRGAQSLSGPRRVAPRLFSEPLPEPGEEEVRAASTLALDELVRFVRNPIAYLLNRRLSVYLRDDELDIPDREPLELDALQKYQVGDRLLDLRLDGVDRERSLALERAQGALPPGATGRWEHAQVLAVVDELTYRVKAVQTGEPLPPLAVNHVLSDGTRLIGALGGLWPRGMVKYQYSRLRAKTQLETWVRHLVLCCVAPDDMPKRTFLIGRGDEWQRGAGKFDEVNKTYRFEPVEEPAALLVELVGQMRAGLRAPLLLPPDTSLRYATKMHYKGDEAAAIDSAQREWSKRMGERTWDAHLRRVLDGGQPPFEDVVTEGLDFERLATMVFSPLLASRKDER